jgi:hypothetical protein
MKCHKCGFISFDYLSECKKCGVDLTAGREKMGFSSIKPSEPFFLASLLKSHVSEPRSGPGTTAASEAAWNDLAEIDLGDEPALDLDLSDSDDASTVSLPFTVHAGKGDEPVSKLKAPTEPGKPVFTRHESGLGDELELDLDSVLDAASSGVTQQKPKPDTAGIQLRLDDTDMDISVDNLDLVIEDAESIKGNGVTERVVRSPAASAKSPHGELDMSDERFGNTEAETVIELSSDDLESLLEELEEAPGGGAKKGTSGSGSGSGGPKK